MLFSISHSVCYFDFDLLHICMDHEYSDEAAAEPVLGDDTTLDDIIIEYVWLPWCCIL